jgi:chromosome segregation ATPase
MALTTEDLLAISQLLDAKLDSKFKTELQPIKDGLLLLKDDVQTLKSDVQLLKDNVQTLKSDVQLLKDDVQALKSDVQVLKGDVQVLKDDVQVLKDDIQVLKDDVQVLKDDVQVLKDDAQVLKDDIQASKDNLLALDFKVTKTQVHLENITDKNLQLLAENYMPAAKRYEKAFKQLEIIQTDIDLIKKVVTDHSQRLQMLG